MFRQITLPITIRAVLFAAAILVGTSLATRHESELIINGETSPTVVPYQVSLQIYYRRRWSHICGGSIVSPRHVLTAAHCLTDPSTRRASKRILAGTRNLKSGGRTYRVASFTIHPDYKEFNGSDIALIKVKRSFNINQRSIGMVNYNQTDDIAANVQAMFTGWGLTEVGRPNLLQNATFITLAQDNCRQMYLPFLSSTDICTLCVPNCCAYSGDSGGPLVILEQNLQIGVLSYGALNNPTKFPNVFTRVSKFVNWIRNNTEEA